MADFLKSWMQQTTPDAAVATLCVLEERPGARDDVQHAIDEAVTDHLADLAIIDRMGSYKKALAYVRNKMPLSKRVRSGDFGEILASEYIDQFTEYRVPIKKLRWKDDRAVAMRGNDVIAIRKRGQRWHLLKAESKSRASLGDAALIEAIQGLDKDGGRPNPSSLAFISQRLREQNRDSEAAIFENFQSRSIRSGDVEHMIFALSGNNPTAYLKKCAPGDDAAFPRHLIGCRIPDHQVFLNSVFDRIHAGKCR